MRSRLHLALASAALSAGLTTATAWTATRVTDSSDCEGWDCLGVFLLALAVGVLVVTVAWGAVLRALGQRLPWLVPVASLVSAYLLSGVLPALPGSAAARGFPVLVLAAAAWAAALGPRPPKGYGDLR